MHQSPADRARCTGAKSVRGQPLPPCVQCERRIMPTDPGARVPVSSWQPMQVAGEWLCGGHIPYSDEASA